MLKRKKMMKRRRKLTVCVGLILMCAFMVNLAMAKRMEAQTFKVVVKKGDSVWKIAGENNPNNADIRRLVYEIIDMNNIEDGKIFAGQELVIPLLD